jgi:hypothetical protein
MCCFESLERRKKKLVTFNYPAGPITFHLKDEVARDEGEWEHGRYHMLIQRLVRTDNKDEWIRFTYYRQPPGESRWRFAGQTSFATTSASLKDLFGLAMEKKWFKSMVARPKAKTE